MSPSLTVPQAHHDRLLQVLPPTGITIQVSFYDRSAEEVRPHVTARYYGALPAIGFKLPLVELGRSHPVYV